MAIRKAIAKAKIDFKKVFGSNAVMVWGWLNMGGNFNYFVDISVAKINKMFNYISHMSENGTVYDKISDFDGYSVELFSRNEENGDEYYIVYNKDKNAKDKKRTDRKVLLKANGFEIYSRFFICRADRHGNLINVDNDYLREVIDEEFFNKI